MNKAFYIESTATTAWREIADRHVTDQDTLGTLARSLVTLIDAYEHARVTAGSPA